MLERKIEGDAVAPVGSCRCLTAGSLAEDDTNGILHRLTNRSRYFEKTLAKGKATS
jgi:hypothetical protein